MHNRHTVVLKRIQKCVPTDKIFYGQAECERVTKTGKRLLEVCFTVYGLAVDTLQLNRGKKWLKMDF